RWRQRRAHDMAVRRMVQVGPVPSPGWWCRAELQRDWAWEQTAISHGHGSYRAYRPRPLAQHNLALHQLTSKSSLISKDRLRPHAFSIEEWRLKLYVGK